VGTWCYDNPSNLFFDGKGICSSGRGVQQGDPRGPLLCCLVMRHVSLGVANIFSSTDMPQMALNTSYLDDGLFGHNLGTLTRALEYLQSPTVPSLGFYLDVDKSSIYQPNQLPISQLLPADLPLERGPSSGLKLLGAPIGNLEFCSGVLERTVVVRNTRTCPVQSVALLTHPCAIKHRTSKIVGYDKPFGCLLESF
jgi:hypothetical protein